MSADPNVASDSSPDPGAPVVSVVIPCFNGAQRVPTALEGLFAAIAVATVPVEVIVVDNGSVDDTSEVVATRFATVRLHRLEVNAGYGGGVKAGVALARGRILAIVSDDFLIEGDLFNPIVPHFDRPDTFGVMPKVLDHPSGELDVLPFVPKVKHGRTKYACVSGVPTGRPGPFPIFFVGGGLAFYDLERFRTLGGQTDIYLPGYEEDVDICWRAWSRGWRSYYEPGAVVRHARHTGAFSTSYRAATRSALIIRNRTLLNVVNLDMSPWLQLFWLFVRTLRRTLVKPWKALPQLMAIVPTLARLPEALRLRRREQRERTRTSAEVFDELVRFWRSTAPAAAPSEAAPSP